MSKLRMGIYLSKEEYEVVTRALNHWMTIGVDDDSIMKKWPEWRLLDA